MSSKQQAIFVGAIVTGVLSTSYLAVINVLCCLGVILGGAIAVQQYTAIERTSVEAGDGALLGALAGAGGVIISTLLDQALKPFQLDSQSIMQDALQTYMENMQGTDAMPQQALQGGDPGIGMMLVSLVFGLVLYGVFGAIGGAIGASIFGSDEE
jgi:hypothetical protein